MQYRLCPVLCCPGCCRISVLSVLQLEHLRQFASCCSLLQQHMRLICQRSNSMQVARWFMERSMVVDARTGSLSLAAQYLQAGLQGGDFEGVIEGCDSPLETLLLEVQTAASAGNGPP